MGNDGCNALDGVKTKLFKFSVFREVDGVVRRTVVLHVIPGGCKYEANDVVFAAHRMQQAECN